MKKTRRKVMFVSTLIAGVFALTQLTAFAATDFGSAGALADQEYTLSEMLTYAIQDEYLAGEEYEAIMDRFGVKNPFANIVKSEATHVNLLLPLFQAYAVSVPANDAANRTVIPSSLAEAYATGASAEINNIAMYDAFLLQEIPSDVKTVFEKLKAASKQHLAAFNNAAAGTTKSPAKATKPLSKATKSTAKGRQTNNVGGQRTALVRR